MRRQLSPPALALLRRLYEAPAEVPSAPRDALRELTRAGLVRYCDGLPEVTARGVNRLQREGEQ